MSSWHTQSQLHVPPRIPEGVIPAPLAHDYPTKSRGPSGLTYTWRLWRHCCCRYGWYPLIVAPLVTAGCLLSLYSAAGCDFVRVDIGFTPSNDGWNQSSVEFGLFQYQSGEPDIEKYREALVEGCRVYESNFSSIFIDDDRTWKVARIMAYISGVASMLSMVTSWLFVISPLPASFFWPGVLLPSLMAAFLAEGSKFLMFDTSICRSSVWFPSGADSLPQVAKECTLGSTSYFCIAAGSIFFVGLLLVCLKAPEKRLLDSEYGTRTELENGGSLASHHNFIRTNESFGDRDMYSEDFEMSRASSIRDDRSEMQFSFGSRPRSLESREYRYDVENPNECADSLSGRLSEDYRQHDDLVTERLKSLDGEDTRYTSRIDEELDDSSNDERYNPKKPTAGARDEEQSAVSESRLHAAERLRLSSTTESRDLIERFVNEVNSSFAKDEKVGDREEEEEDYNDDEEKKDESGSWTSEAR